MKGASYSILYVELSEVQDLVSNWETRGACIETKISELETRVPDTYSFVSKEYFELFRCRYLCCLNY